MRLLGWGGRVPMWPCGRAAALQSQAEGGERLPSGQGPRKALAPQAFMKSFVSPLCPLERMTFVWQLLVISHFHAQSRWFC